MGGNLWIPVAIAVSAVVYTLGSNVLMQVEDMTYSMMAGTLTNITTLILITHVDWNKGSANAEEILSYSIVTLLAMVYMPLYREHANFVQRSAVATCEGLWRLRQGVPAAWC